MFQCRVILVNSIELGAIMYLGLIVKLGLDILMSYKQISAVLDQTVQIIFLRHYKYLS